MKNHIMDDGNGIRSVLVPVNCEEAVAYAAEKLTEYVRRTAGIALCICSELQQGAFFSLGKTNAISEKEYNLLLQDVQGDGFYIHAKRGCVYVAARTCRGIIYGVYEYIERFLGVRFLTADCEYVPRVCSVPVPEKDVLSNPAFFMRTYLVGDTFQKTADLDHLIRTRVDDLFTPVPEKYGGKEKVYGRGVNHNFHLYVPFEKYGNTHPEFYRFLYINGETVPTIDLTNGIADDGSLDESMPVSVAKIVVEELIKTADEHPDAEVLTFTQEDGPYYFDSPRNRRFARKYKRSGILIRFCNAVLRRVNAFLRENRGGRQIRLMTFAYAYAKEPPVRKVRGGYAPVDETVVADENLVIQFALFSNGFYDYFSDKQDASLRSCINGWRVIASRFWFWAYDINFNRYLAYYDSFANIGANVRGFRDLGIEYLCMQGSHDSLGNWQCNMRAYVYRKLMWDPSLAAEELLDEFIRLYYGPGAFAVSEMMRIFHENFLKQKTEVVCKTFGSHAKAECNPLEMLETAIDVLEKGEKKVSSADLSAEEKDKYLFRLSQVKATPLMLLADHFREYLPHGDEDARVAACERFYIAAQCGGVDMTGERWTLAQYMEELRVSEGNRDFWIPEK